MHIMHFDVNSIQMVLVCKGVWYKIKMYLCKPGLCLYLLDKSIKGFLQLLQGPSGCDTRDFCRCVSEFFGILA